MDELTWLADAGTLRRPLFVVALRGMFDAAEAATDAVERLEDRYSAEPLADIDPENFFDFQQERPLVELDEDGERRIRWPRNRATAATIPNSRHDLVLLSGVEPHLRWRTFSSHLVTIAQRTQAEMVVTVGAMVGLAPHTRPLGVVGSATDSTLAARLGLGRPSYEGPTGLVGALHDALDTADIPVISLRVSVPHYVPNPPNPEASRSLLRRFELVTGIDTGHHALDASAETWRSRVDAAVGADSDLLDYVRNLERQVDESDDLFPSGDDLMRELEAYLRERGEE
ncbi:MAG: PAC2 family protein [Acidimicrobiales bacterium]|nr:PAC2 family protein [Acidimicrobiales bacterium]